MKRTIKLHHPTGNPFWKEGEFTIEMPEGNMLDFKEANWAYKIHVDKQGIWYNRYVCGSGFGKILCTGMNGLEKLLVSKSEYDEIEYVGVHVSIPEDFF